MDAKCKVARTTTILLLALAVVSNAQYYGQYSGNYGSYSNYGSYGNYGDYDKKDEPKGVCEDPDDEQTTGVFYDWGAHEGYNFFSVHSGRDSYIVDNEGKVKQKWEEPDGLAFVHSEFTDDGTLLRSGRWFSAHFNDQFYTGADFIREYNKDGECTWEFRYSTISYRLTRNFEVLPNGNVVATAWQNHPIFDARIRGYEGEANEEPHGFWSYTLVEVPRKGHENPDWIPEGHNDGDRNTTCKYISDENDLVWKWDSFDHSSDYINEYLYDINLPFKINDIEYYPDRDHLMIICDICGEVFIIDHGLDFQKVPWNGHFIYRWGNPANYGKEGDHMLGANNINWVQDRFGYDFKKDQVGSVTVFNNRDPQEDEETSSLVQFTPPYDEMKKEYERQKDGTFGPKDFDWKILKVQEKVKSKDSYDYEYPWLTFDSLTLSFLQEFPDKNLLATSTIQNFAVEVEDGSRAVWKYTSPFYNDGDRKFIDTPDEELDICEDIPACGLYLCTRLTRVIRFSKDHKGIDKLRNGY